MHIAGIDHLVLTVDDIEKTVRFYTAVLGMNVEHFDKDRLALRFGRQKINLHERGKEREPKAGLPTPGSADICFLTDTAIEAAMQHVEQQGVTIIAGPVARTGATGNLVSFYFRDPDLNLIEVAHII